MSKKRSKKKKSSTSPAKLKKTASMSKFKKETLLEVIGTSLMWESIEQIFFWDLLCSHESVSTSYLLPIFNRLDSTKNAEATGFLFDILKCHDPTFDLVKLVIFRRCEDNLARSLLINWARGSSGTEKMSQIFIRLLKMSLSSSASQTSSQQSMSSQQTTMKKIKYNETLSSNNKVDSCEIFKWFDFIGMKS
jgi:hypothetical protein